MIHEPMLGRTNVSEPVCSSSSAPPWREFEPCIDLMKQRSSTHFATSGNKSLTQAPLCPYCLNAQGDCSRLNVSLETTFGPRERQRLAVIALQKRLVVKGVHLRRAAVHEEEDHPLRASRESAAACTAKGSTEAAPPGLFLCKQTSKR